MAKVLDLLRGGRLCSVRECPHAAFRPRAIAEYIALLEREEAERTAA
jgi:hypothetical protein